MSSIDNIEKIITWYKSLKRDFAGVNDLMYARQQLACLFSDVAIQIASLVEQRNGCESQRNWGIHAAQGLRGVGGDAGLAAFICHCKLFSHLFS